MAASSGEEEEEEYEYEEVEVEEEEEEDEDEIIEEEDEEEPEEEDEEEEEPEEVEEVVEEEEEEEEPIEEQQQEEEDDEHLEEEDEEEEEEYEEIEEEIEVTDDEHLPMEVDMDISAEDTAVVIAADEVLQTTATPEVSLLHGSSDYLPQDVRQDEQSKENELCSNSRIQDTKNSELAAPLDIHDDEPIGSKLGSKSPSQQSRKGKEVVSIDDVSSSLPERLKSVADTPKLRGITVRGDQGLVEISPVASLAEDEQTHGKPIIQAVTSDSHVSAPDGICDKLRKIEKSVFGETRVPSQKEELHVPSSGNMDQKASRYYAPQMRPRSRSPGADCEVISKRSAMVCEYFAKGWCIKGSSCRFLHKRDQVDFPRGQVEGDMMPTKAEIRPGSGDGAGTSNSPVHKRPKFYITNSDDGLPIPKDGSYTEKDHKDNINDDDNFRLLERDFPRPHLSISSQRSPSSKDGSKVFSKQNEAEVDKFKGSRSSDHLDHHGSSVPFGRSTLLENFTPGHGFLSRGMGGNSGTQMNYSMHSYAMVDESVDMRRQYTLDLHGSPIRGFSAKCSGSSRNSSLLDNPSLQDLLLSYKNERKFTPYKWEPSVPFRPSHFITSFTTLSSDVQYDPLRDSIDQQELGRGSFRHSSYGQTQGLTYQHAHSISGRNSLDSHKRLHSDSNYKDYYSHGKDAPTIEAESAAISATNPENKNISDEESPVVATSVKDVLKATKSVTDENSKVKIEDSRHKGEIRKQNNELDEEDSKVIKFFRAALIEFVKELMKPVWHEGRLSKDVYKVIVQKAEDKILSTLPSNEVPNTPESIKQYLSSSRPNILKLIQAYVDKYGKF